MTGIIINLLTANVAIFEHVHNAKSETEILGS